MAAMTIVGMRWEVRGCNYFWVEGRDRRGIWGKLGATSQHAEKGCLLQTTKV